MNIAFYGCKQNFTGAFSLSCCALLLDVRGELCNSLFHYACALHHLRKKHFPGSEKVAHLIHPAHQRTFDEVDGPVEQCAGLFYILLNELIKSSYQRVPDPFHNGQESPFVALLFLLTFILQSFGKFHQPFRSILPPVQDNIFGKMKKVGRNFAVYLKHAGIDNSHIEPCIYGMVQEDGMHRFTHPVDSPERK